MSLVNLITEFYQLRATLVTVGSEVLLESTEDHVAPVVTGRCCYSRENVNHDRGDILLERPVSQLLISK